MPRSFWAPLLLLCVGIHAAEERLWIDAKVNGKEAKIFLDTGASEFYLFRHGAERLGLEVPEASAGASDWKMYWADEKCDLECTGFAGKIRPAIAEPPSILAVGNTDGFLGWRLIRKNIVKFDALHLAVSALPKLPEETRAWTRLKVRTNKPSGWRKWGILALEISPREIVIIDTGSESGAGIPQARWGAWKSANPDRPITVEAVAMPLVGLFAREQAKAPELKIGSVQLTDVIVEEAEPWSGSMAREQHAATLGLAALKRIDLIVDGKKNYAYLRPKTSPAPPYPHNRLGAVFLPRGGEEMVATVALGSPAFEAGIRDGDVLLKINDASVAAKNGKAGMASGLQRAAFWEQPAGMSLRLTLRRDGREFECVAVLRDLLN